MWTPRRNLERRSIYAVTPVAGDGSERKRVELYGPFVLDDQDGLNDAWKVFYFNSLTQVAEDNPVNVTVNIETIPGDLNGDSLVNLEDALVGVRIGSGARPASGINMAGDTNANDRADMMNALFILQTMR